jgi:hypothetical protein
MLLGIQIHVAVKEMEDTPQHLKCLCLALDHQTNVGL